MESAKQVSYSALWELSKCKYTSCYCEENVYLLCKNFLEKELGQSQDPNIKSEAFAVFITNKQKKAELRRQKGGKGQLHDTVVWDYHVIFIHKATSKSETETVISFVYDLDTTLNFPEEFASYYKAAFDFPKKYELFFRVIDAKSLIQVFATDRSHMVTGVKKVGKKFVKTYSSPIPDYPNIVNAAGEIMNLDKFLDLDNHEEAFGKILNQIEFHKLFTSP